MRQPVDLRISVCVDLYKLEGDVCLCESAADTLFSPLQQFAGSAQGLLDRSPFLLQQFSIDFTSVNSDRLSKSF